MDILRPDILRAKNRKLAVWVAVAMLFVVGVSGGVSRLRPAAPSVDKATIWTDEVKRGDMLREVRGLGMFVPEEIRWIPAQSDGVVDRILLSPGAVVNPDSVILELSNPQLQRDALDAESQLKAAEADYQNLKTQIANENLDQKAAIADARSQYQEAKIQSDLDEKLGAEGLKSEIAMQQSRIKSQQLAAHVATEEARARNAEDSAQARLTVQLATVAQQRSQYNQRRSELNALRVRAGVGGVLESVSVEVGQRVAAGTNLVRVADPRRLKAEIQIPATQAKDVIIGQKAAIDTHDGIVDGRVTRIDPAVQNGTVAVDVTLTGPLPLDARPDLSVDGNIEIERLKDVLYVGLPVHCEANSTGSIFKIVGGDGVKAVRVTVRLGRSSANAIEIREGLQAGDKVILSDMSQWDRFDRVRLK